MSEWLTALEQSPLLWAGYGLMALMALLGAVGIVTRRMR